MSWSWALYPRIKWFLTSFFCLQCKIGMVFSHWWYILLIYPRRIGDVLLGNLMHAANFASEHPEENSIFSLILPSTADVLYFRGKKKPFSILFFASGIRTNVFMLLVFSMLNFIEKNKGKTLKAFLFGSDFFICVSLCFTVWRKQRLPQVSAGEATHSLTKLKEAKT